jgi:hypothetical protein
MNVEELDVDTIYMYSREWLMNRVMWYLLVVNCILLPLKSWVQPL